MPRFLAELKQIGFSGVQNFPTVGLLDGRHRQGLEETGMGFALEVEMIRAARELDLVTTPYVFDVPSTVAMTEAGADVVVPHLGTTTSGMIGASSAMSLDDAVDFVQELHDAAVAVNPDVLVLCHGGPIAEPEERRLRAAADEWRGGLLRRVEHGAPARRTSDHGADAQVQSDRRRLEIV